MSGVRWADGVLTLEVKVQPRSSREGVTGRVGDKVKIALTAPPVDGAANQALIRFLAQELAVAKGRVVLISGQTSREKLLRVEGVSREVMEGFCRKWGLAIGA